MTLGQSLLAFQSQRSLVHQDPQGPTESPLLSPSPQPHLWGAETGVSLRLAHLGTWAQPLEKDVCVEKGATVVLGQILSFLSRGKVGSRGLWSVLLSLECVI